MARLPRPRTPMLTRRGEIAREWIRYFDSLTDEALATIDLDSGDVTGILQPANGGTGVTTGLNGLTNANLSAAAAIAWSKISKSGSSLADLATRSASDLSTAVVPYATTWEGSGGTPTLNDGTLSASYVRIGGLYAVSVDLTIGAGTVIAGTGDWRFSLPVALSVDFMGVANVTSGGVASVGACARYNSTNLQGNTNGNGIIGAASPVAFAAGDILRLAMLGHV